MKIKYRGNEYKSETSLLEVREGDIIGKYRGSQFTRKFPKHIPQLRPKLGLTYRGVTYNSCPNAHPVFPCSEVTVKMPPYVRKQATNNNLEQIHLENLRRNLERRIKVAQETHNDYLLEMLEREFQELAVN